MMKPETIKRAQIVGTGLVVLVLGGLAVQRTLNPASYDHQAMIDLHFHPIASILGALLPTVIISVPFVYWIFGRIMRRMAARFKICEHCAETIKSDAKVCHYCGREVAPAGQVEVGAQQRAEDDQRRPEADATHATANGKVGTETAGERIAAEAALELVSTHFTNKLGQDRQWQEELKKQEREKQINATAGKDGSREWPEKIFSFVGLIGLIVGGIAIVVSILQFYR